MPQHNLHLAEALTAEELAQDTVKVSSLPTIYTQLHEAINHPRSSMADIARIIGQDQSLTARLLKLANSPLFGYYSRIDTINEAVTILGTQQICDLTLTVSVVEIFSGIPEELINMEAFWRHSIGCGLIARIIATCRREPNIERYFVNGMLHDIGRLVCYAKLPELSRETLLAARTQDRMLYQVEQELIGFDHADVGGYLLREWKLPLSIEEPVRLHHSPGQATRFPTEAAVVHLADIIGHALGLGSSGETLVPPMEPAAWERIELPPSIISFLLNQIERQYSAAIAILSGE